jgi:DNA mismatch repair protein MSH6
LKQKVYFRRNLLILRSLQSSDVRNISTFSFPTDSTSNHPVARKSLSNASDDDDDFTVPDSDTDVKSVKSSSSRSTASRRSAASSDEASDDDKPQKSKSKAKPTRKHGTKAAAVTDGTSGSTNSFLTAAEQREQGKKNEKKAADEAYSFLTDVQDVGFTPSTNFIVRNMEVFLERSSETWRS